MFSFLNKTIIKKLNEKSDTDKKKLHLNIVKYNYINLLFPVFIEKHQ